MSKLGLSSDEEEILKTICEYLFFDQYTYSATFQRFEQCFQPLFISNTNLEKNNKSNSSIISTETIFKEICGPKKKYITSKRILKSYLEYKNNTGKISPDLKIFFDLLLNNILQKDPVEIGKPREQCYNYSTTKANNKRECISQIQILTDKNNVIHGINMMYDDVFENQMYPTVLETNLNISLEMNLGIVDEKPIKQRQIGKNKEIKEKFYRDAITHIFGTINSKNIISFFGFKCISGKTEFVGNPEGKGFLIGGFGKKFHSIKLQMTEDGIHLLNPFFNENPRTNFFIRKIFDTLTMNDLSKEDFVLDEEHLEKIQNDEDIDKFITTPILEDNHFFNNKLKDKISGNDYKEVVNQAPRNWIIRKDKERKNLKNLQKINNINDALRTFDEENKRRGLNPNIFMPQLRNIKGKQKFGNKNDINANKNKIGQKRLHKKKRFRRIRDEDEENDRRNNIPRWNGNKENMKDINPNIFYRSKYNYRNLKNELARSIQQEIIESNEEDFTDNKEALLEQIFPEMADYQGKKDFNKNVPSMKKKKLKKKQILKKLNSLGDEVVYRKKFSDDIENSTTVYSDALQIFNDFSDKNKKKSNTNLSTSGHYSDDDENLFGFGLSEKYFPSLDESEEKILRGKGYSYAPVANDLSNNRRKNNYYISGSNPSLSKYTYNDPKKIKAAQENYKKFSSQLKKVNGIYLLQTMGAIIKAMHVIDDNNKGKKRIFLSEKIKLLKLLEENEIIIDFLTQKDKKEAQIETEINTVEGETNSEDETDDEDILIPDEHPEKITSLTELEQNIKDISNLLENKKLTEEQKLKLEKLKNLYLQQKNILIENETNNIKKEIINENKINIEKIIKEEENKRIIAEKENQKYLEELEKQKKLEEQKEKERKEKERKKI